MLNFDEAAQQLDKLVGSEHFSLETLENLVNEVSCIDPMAENGATTNLYSKVDVKTIVDLNNDTNVRVIDRTPVSKFLNSAAFRKALNAVIQKANPDKDRAITDQMAIDYLNNATTGLWASASRQFASETEGNVKGYMGAGAENRIMVNVELPEIIINNQKVKLSGIELTPMENMSKEERQRIADKLVECLQEGLNKCLRPESEQVAFKEMTEKLAQKTERSLDPAQWAEEVKNSKEITDRFPGVKIYEKPNKQLAYDGEVVHKGQNDSFFALKTNKGNAIMLFDAKKLPENGKSPEKGAHVRVNFQGEAMQVRPSREKTNDRGNEREGRSR